MKKSHHTYPKPPSDAQIRYLRALGDTDPAPVTQADASWRIDAAKSKRKNFEPMKLNGAPEIVLASERQIQMLRKLGYEGPEDITSTEALKLHGYLRRTTDNW